MVSIGGGAAGAGGATLLKRFRGRLNSRGDIPTPCLNFVGSYMFNGCFAQHMHSVVGSAHGGSSVWGHIS